MLSQYHQDSWISSFPTKHQQVVTCFYHFLSTSRNFHNVSFSRPFLCRWLIFNSGGHFLVTLSALLGKVLWILLLGQLHFCLISAEKSKSFWIICKCLKSDTCQVLHQKPNRILDETAGSYINMRKLRQMPPAIALLQYLPTVCYTDRRPWCGFELLTSMIHSSPTHRWNAKLSLDEFDQKEIEEGWWRLPKQTCSQQLIFLKSPSSQAVSSHCNGEAGRRSNSATVSPSVDSCRLLFSTTLWCHASAWNGKQTRNKAVFSFDWSWIPVPYAPLAHCRIAQVLMGHLQDRTCHHQWPWPTANQWLWCKFHLSQVRKLRKLCKLPHQATSCDCWTSISWRPGSCPHEQSSAYSVENKQ